jgi:hypothetical protein
MKQPANRQLAALSPHVEGLAVKDFINPQSMLTPGLAGALVTMISTTVGPVLALNPLHCILALSFVIGLIVLVNAATWWLKIVYYFVNSLVICAMAIGALAGVKGAVIDPDHGPPSLRQASATNGLEVTTTAVSVSSPAPAGK